MAKKINTPTRKFRIRPGVGSHSVGSKLYRSGDVVASPHDLRKQWPGKFDEVETSTPATVSKIASDPSGDQGSPVQPVISGDDDESTDVPIPDDDDGDDADADDDDVPTGPAGVDYTAKFPKAVEEDYLVYKHEGQFFVYDKDDPSKAVSDGVPKNKVDAVIAKAVASK